VSSVKTRRMAKSTDWKHKRYLSEFDSGDERPKRTRTDLRGGRGNEELDVEGWPTLAEQRSNHSLKKGGIMVRVPQISNDYRVAEKG